MSTPSMPPPTRYPIHKPPRPYQPVTNKYQYNALPTTTNNTPTTLSAIPETDYDPRILENLHRYTLYQQIALLPQQIRYFAQNQRTREQQIDHLFQSGNDAKYNRHFTYSIKPDCNTWLLRHYDAIRNEYTIVHEYNTNITTIISARWLIAREPCIILKEALYPHPTFIRWKPQYKQLALGTISTSTSSENTPTPSESTSSTINTTDSTTNTILTYKDSINDTIVSKLLQANKIAKQRIQQLLVTNETITKDPGAHIAETLSINSDLTIYNELQEYHNTTKSQRKTIDNLKDVIDTQTTDITTLTQQVNKLK
jgi:hypothetical protein